MKKFIYLMITGIFLFNISLNTTALVQPDISISEESSVSKITNTENSVISRSALTEINHDTIYNIKNVGSGKYLNVHYGVDANGTNVYQWTYDGSTEQKFRIVYSSDTDTYKIYAMCSSNGTNRVLDVARNGSSLSHGQNVDIWTPIDSTAQTLKIIPLGQNQYRICMQFNQNLYLTANGNSNGTSGGTSSTSAGNVYISNYVGDTYQHWIFEAVGTITPAEPYGYIDSITSNSISGWAWRSDIPDIPLTVHIHISSQVTNETVVYSTMANLYRQDLYNAGYGNGCHGFNFSIDWKDFPIGTCQIAVFAIGGTNPPLAGCPALYQVQNTIGYKGYAVYRDLSDPVNLVFTDWHAGLMDEPSAQDNLCVIDMPGVFGEIRWISWNGFLDGLTYRGTYRPKDNSLCDNDRISIITLARELQAHDIGYNAIYQLGASFKSNAEKIEPGDITSIRCDGLVEYCYEYYGYRIFGSDSLWDISKASEENVAHHHSLNIMPQAQATTYMDLVTSGVPN